MYDFRRNFKENERRFDKKGYQLNGYIGINGIITDEDIKRILTKKLRNTT